LAPEDGSEALVERRLAAILAADAVGYSRLMRKDEPGALALLHKHRSEVIDPAIAKHRGRTVKLMGDGLLAEFSSVVESVDCAAEIQRTMAARNGGSRGDRQMAFRIGVHLGDVIVEGDDLYGDGVNIAARLEGIAERGGVCISRQAYDQVQNKLALGYRSLGPQHLKNIRSRSKPSPSRATGWQFPTNGRRFATAVRRTACGSPMRSAGKVLLW
jgi:adenylate cyclase